MGSRELQTSQTHLDPLEDKGGSPLGNHFESHEGQEGD